MEILILGITVIVNWKLSKKYDCAKTNIEKVESQLKNLPANTNAKRRARRERLSVDAGIRVSKVYAKRVLGDATGLTKAAFREAFTELPCLIDYMNSEGKCRAFVRWTDGAGRGLNVVNDNIRYFAEYGICAKGIRDFVASVGVPFFSFDACHAKHLYYQQLLIMVMPSPLSTRNPSR